MGLIEYIKNLFDIKRRCIKREKKESANNIMALVYAMNDVTKRLTREVNYHITHSNYCMLDKTLDNYRHTIEPLRKNLCYKLGLYKDYGKLEEALLTA